MSTEPDEHESQPQPRWPVYEPRRPPCCLVAILILFLSLGPGLAVEMWLGYRGLGITIALGLFLLAIHAMGPIGWLTHVPERGLQMGFVLGALLLGLGMALYTRWYGDASRPKQASDAPATIKEAP